METIGWAGAHQIRRTSKRRSFGRIMKSTCGVMVLLFHFFGLQAQIVDDIVLLSDVRTADSLEGRSLGRSDMRKLIFEPQTANLQLNGTDTVRIMMHDGEVTVLISFKDGMNYRSIGYYDNGNTSFESNFDGKEMHGRYVSYYRNGQRKYLRYYEHGKMIPPGIDYYENGRIEQISDEDVLTGQSCCVAWNESGQLDYVREGVIESDEEEAFTEKRYYPNGGMVLSAIYNAGIQEYEDYYQNGNIASKGKIYNVSLSQVGPWISMHDNGQPKREYFFDEQMPNYRIGTWKWWDRKGNLLRLEQYEGDSLISVKSYLKPYEYNGKGDLRDTLSLIGTEASITLSYEFHGDPDELIISDIWGNELYRTGMVTTPERKDTIIQIQYLSEIIVEVQGSKKNSKWNFTISLE